MNLLILCLLLLAPVATLGEVQPEQPEPPEPNLFAHYLSLKQMQESLAGRSLEDQTRLRPQIDRAERKACERLRKERQARVPKEQYRQEGGDEFLVFALQLEQYCHTLR